MKKLTLSLIALGLLFAANAHAQVVNPPLLRKVGSNIYPLGNVPSTTIGTSTAVGQFGTLTDANGNQYSTSTGITSAPATTTINKAVGPSFTFSVVNTSSPSSITTSSAQVFLNLLQLNSSTDITISSTGTIVFANHNISQFTNNVGYGTSNVSTSSANSWTASQTFSATTTFNATATFSNGFSMFGPAFITGAVNTVYWFPTPAQLAAGLTCGTTASVTESGNCVQDMYTAGSLVGSSTQINVGAYRYNISNSVNWNQQSELALLEGVPGGGTVFNWTGNTTGTVLTINDCNSNAKRPALQVQHITFSGSNASTTNGGLTAIYAGGTNGACATQLDDIYVGGFTYDLQTASNTYWFELSNSELTNAYRALWQNSPSNSGETMVYYNDKFADPAGPSIGGISSSTNYVYLDSNSSPSTQFRLGSMDDGGLGAACGNLQVSINGVHFENPADASGLVYPSYDYINELSCASGGTQINTSYDTFMQDATSTATGAPNEFVNAGSVFTALNDTLARGGSGTSTNRFVNNTNSTANSIITLTGTNNKGAGAANLFPAAIYSSGNQQSNNGTLVSTANAYAVGTDAPGGTGSPLNFESGGGTTAAFFTPAGASFQNGEVLSIGGAPSSGSSTLYINGDIGFRVANNTVSSTLPSGGASGWPAEWQVCGGAANTTDTMPYATSTQGTMITWKNIGAGTCFIAVTSTDVFRLATTTTSTASIALTPGSSTQLVNFGILAGTQAVWDQLWVR